MTPHYADPWLTVYLGDCREVMAQMEPESVHCVVTSPPYWGLRDYGAEGQLGLELTPEEYVANMVAVFREVRRVLRSDGTVWLNLGDSYAAGGAGPTGSASTLRGNGHIGGGPKVKARESVRRETVAGLKPKDLVGIPWRVAFALQADGWYLRSDIIWSKPNPMPESVTDRPTKAHEYLFLLSKSPRYYYDADAVREPNITQEHFDRYNGRPNISPKHDGEHYRAHQGGVGNNPAGRNLRSVWTIATQPYPGAHFATFPPKLVEPCIKAGTSEKGVCPECGAPWVREVERTVNYTSGSGRAGNPPSGKNGSDYEQATSGTYDIRMGPSIRSATTGWRPSCRHDAAPVPSVVLDPFAGSGTTGMVAQSLSRRAVLIDLSAEYLKQLMDRNRDMPLGLGA